MKASDSFTQTIEKYLKNLAGSDPLFAVTFKKANKNITDCTNYIMNTVKDSGRNGFDDSEIYGMAVHYYDEDNLKPIKAVSGKVVVNHSAGKSTTAAAGPAAVAVNKKVKKPAVVQFKQTTLF